ncbi:hypothetical protein NC651_004534 [Populus alba x Populus x berolinensis]|nr:hypothetical protein NC651_004534 [Populus alba x Populus x berolinensis]
MEMRIGASNKVGYLIGATTKPALNDPNYDTWITENHKLIGYLEWWDFSKQPRKNITGKAAMATTGVSVPTLEIRTLVTIGVYWKRASRKEEIKVKMMVADDGTLSEIVVQGDDQQVEQMRKELQFSEKGMVYVKGIFKR